MRSLFFLIFGSFIVSASLFQAVFAQTPDVANMLPPGAVLVASVGLHDTKIISKEGNKVNFSFTFSNEGEQQSGVKYGARLVKEELVNNLVKQTVVHEYIYDEVLTLASNTTVPVSATYIAPENIEGTYKLHVVSRNTKGFPLGEQVVGEILFESEVKGVRLLAETCTVMTSRNQTASTLPLNLFVADLAAEETAQITCTFANNTENEIVLTPSFVTREGSLYGDTIKAVGGSTEAVTFVPNGQTTQTIALPKAEKPGKYAVSMSFGEGNTVSVSYIVLGKSASISNLTLDKNSYKKGEVATLKMLWTSTEPSLVVKASIKGTLFACASEVTQTITLDPAKPFAIIELPMKRNCADPKIVVQLTDTEGTVLDQDEVIVTTEGGMINRSTKITLMIVVALAVIAITTSILKRKKEIQPEM